MKSRQSKTTTGVVISESESRQEPTTIRKPEERLSQGSAPMSLQDTRKMLHELEVHQVELEMQNEALRQAQDTIIASRERYAELYDFAPVGYFTFDNLGVITEVNLTGASLLGVERAKLSKKPFSLFVAPSSRDTFHRHYRDVLRTGAAGTCELQLTRGRDGASFYASVHSVPVWDHEGNPTGVRSAIDDITERKQAEETQRLLAAVQEEKERLSALVNSIQDEVWFADVQKRFTLVNPSALRKLGLYPGSVIDVEELATSLEFYRPDGTARPVNEFPPLRALRGEVVRNQEEISRIPGSGEIRYRQVSSAPVRDLTGTIIGSVSVVRDITDRKRAEAALRESEERFRQVAENVGDFIWEIDADGLYRYTSPSVKKILGYAPDELVGKMHFYDLFTPEVREGLKAAAFEVFATKQPFRAFPNQNLSKDGRLVYLETSGGPMLDEAGNVVGYRGVDLDITERQRLETHLRQAEKMEALGTLTGGVAHDFNNILAAIMGFTELIKGNLPRGSQEESYLQMVMDAGIRGRELIRQMLAFSRQTEQEKKPLLLSGIVQETSRFLRASIPATISIRVKVASESAFILGDPVQLQQVVMNLCLNAAHAMRKKGGVLDLELSEFNVTESKARSDGMKPGIYTKLVVRDTGTGIPPEVINRIFDPFFTTKKPGEGTGLGLSVVEGIIQQHDGYITVESTPGEGSAFTVSLPKIADYSPQEAVSDDAVLTGHEQVLFVDDEEGLTQAGQRILEELGYKVTAVNSSGEALKLFTDDPRGFDLIVTDQTMPAMTGLELAKICMALRPDIPIVLATGFSHLVNADSARAAGVKAFAMKPLTKKEIGQIVRRVLDEPANEYLLSNSDDCFFKNMPMVE